MPFLVLGALTAKATEFRRLADERGGGGLRRTVNGQLRGRSDWVKRGWAGSLLAVDAADLANVLAAANPDTAVLVSGDAIGASVTGRVQVTGDVAYVRERDGWHFVVPVTIREA